MRNRNRFPQFAAWRWAFAIFSLFLLLIWGGCGTSRKKLAPSHDGAAAAAHTPISADPKPVFGPEIRSLRLRKSTTVRSAPDEGAKPRGTIAEDTRVQWFRGKRGKGCKGFWIEIEKEGWVCDRLLEPSRKEPMGVELPRVKEGEIMPGVYGRITKETPAFRSEADVRAQKAARQLAPAVKIRQSAIVEIDNKGYWRTSEGDLVLASAISKIVPSEFSGEDLRDRKLPVAWFVPRAKRAVSGLEKRAVVNVLSAPIENSEREDAGAMPIREIEIEGGLMISEADLRIAWPAAMPPGVLPGEKWIDVDLDQQLLIAYEGSQQVFATLVSTGNTKWPTKTGVYRIYVKFFETDMSGQMGDEAPYSVATVPWTQFFSGDLALHTAYWHDRFGEARSHGCINLSPKDARWLYFWTEPHIFPGYTMAHGTVDFPGTTVRVRSRAATEPDLVGYAKRVFENRSKTGVD